MYYPFDLQDQIGNQWFHHSFLRFVLILCLLERRCLSEGMCLLGFEMKSMLCYVMLRLQAMIRRPFQRLFNGPKQSASTHIDLTSGWVIPLKNLPYSCKYSTGETLKVWFCQRCNCNCQIRKAPEVQHIAIVFQVWVPRKSLKT